MLQESTGTNEAYETSVGDPVPEWAREEAQPHCPTKEKAAFTQLIKFNIN